MNAPLAAINNLERPSQEQRPAVTARGRDVAVVAGAGSGKTRTLVARYLQLLADGVPLRRIVAITFTIKAAREMRNRVREQIGRYVETLVESPERTWWRDRQAEMDGARISTIHSLCGELLRSHPVEADADPRFEMLDEGPQSLLRIQVAEETLAWAVDQEQVAPLFRQLSTQDLFDVLVEAMTKRLELEELLATPRDWETIWQAKAIVLLRERILRPKATEAFGTFADLEARGDLDHAEAQGSKLATNLHDAIALWKELNQALDTGKSAEALALLQRLKPCFDLRVGTPRRWRGDYPKDDLKALRNDWYDPLGKQMAQADPSLDESWFALWSPLEACLREALRRYRLAKDQRNALDFDDLESRALTLLRNHPDIRADWRGRIDALLVDEYQDTNQRQNALVMLLNGSDGEGEQGDNKLFIVGDGKQSIYGFRNADVSVFVDQQRAIERRGGELVRLSSSYRAHHDLLRGLNELMSRVLPEQGLHLARYEVPFQPLRPVRTAPDTSAPGPHIECHLTLGSKADGALDDAATALVARIHQLVSADPTLSYGDVAILCLRTAAFRPYEDALERAGIPYVTVSGRGFYERPEIRDLLNLLRALDNPDDDLALVGALRSPALGLSDVALYHLSALQRERGEADLPTLWQVARDGPDDRLTALDARLLRRAIDLIERLRQDVGRVPVASVLKRTLEETHYPAIARRAGQTRAARNIEKLLTDAYASGMHSISQFDEYVQSLRDVGAREGEARVLSEGAVQLMTVHASKGLEFGVVAIGDAGSGGTQRKPALLIDPEWGVLLKISQDKRFPLTYLAAVEATHAREHAEWLREFYVAATRARERLLISGCMPVKKDGQFGACHGWLGLMADEPILDLLSDPAPSPDASSGPIEWQCPLGESSVLCVFHPEQPREAKASVEPESDASAGSWPPPLLDSLVDDPSAGPPDPDQRSQPIRPALWHGDRPPAVVRGDIVHEALAHWRFPDEGFDAWAQTVAERYNLVEQRLVQRAARDAARLLERFQAHPLYAEMQAAQQRLHEVPFAMPSENGLREGRIDALYRTPQGHWRIVEFKSDRLAERGALAARLSEPDNDYIAQVSGYKQAAERWLGEPVEACLVFLDCGREVVVWPLEP